MKKKEEKVYCFSSKGSKQGIPFPEAEILTLGGNSGLFKRGYEAALSCSPVGAIVYLYPQEIAISGNCWCQPQSLDFFIPVVHDAKDRKLGLG